MPPLFTSIHPAPARRLSGRKGEAASHRGSTDRPITEAAFTRGETWAPKRTRPHLGIKLANGRARFAAELRDEACVLHGHGLVEGGADRNAILVDYYDAYDALVPLQPLDCLFHLARLTGHVCEPLLSFVGN